MEIWQLNTFRVVARTLHFTRASEELKLTQSTVSHQIKSLEEELGVPLFYRDKRSVSLTSQGNTVLEYANRMFQQLGIMKRELEDNKETLQGILNIVTVPRSLNTPFSQVRRDFMELHPEIELRFESVLNSADVFEHVRKGISDIGFTAQNQDFGDLLSIPWGKFEMLFVVGKNHPMANEKEVTFRRLIDEDWILFEEGSWLRRRTNVIFSEQKFVPKKLSNFNDGAVITSLIRDGAGVGFLPSWGIVDILEQEKLTALKIKGAKTDTPLNIIISPSNRTKLVGVFVDYLVGKKVEGIKLFENLT